MINLVFDYDGTLHDSMKIYAPAFRHCCNIMREDGENIREYSDDEIKSWIGMDVKTMWNEFQPDFSEEKKSYYSGFIGENMVSLINEGYAQLYYGVPEMLSRLKRSYRLIFLSNCKRSYMEAHKRAFSLNEYFSEFYCTEDYGFQPKYKIFDQIKKDGEYIVIGDRYSDIETAMRHKLKSIGCLYGYGADNELAQADVQVTTIAELEAAVKKLGRV
ncbi:phosphoglycolate phosphatase [Clostridiales bacterium]|nr:phosphoglycolate phosphatase [Clostridiales bacterium]